MKLDKSSLLFSVILLLFSGSLFPLIAQNTADGIVVIVNEEIILKSDVDSEVANYIQQASVQGQSIPFTKELWIQALESMIDNEVLLIQAKIDSITVSDDQVNRQMDMRINDLIQRAGSEQALERAFGKSIVELRREFRDQFRDQMIVSRVQSEKLSDITITRPEVFDFFNRIPADSLPTIPERIAISQIVIKPEPSSDVRDAAFQKANSIRDSILAGADFEEMAIQFSEGPSAPRGGLIPLLPLNDLVPEYAAAASALSPGEISEVVETEFGFHVIRLNQRQGDQIETNNILIKVDSDKFDDSGAIEKLENIRTQIETGEKTFEEIAREVSEDPNSGPAGGRLYNPLTGERLMGIQELDPALYRIVLLLTEEGDISDPKPFTLMDPTETRAFRIVKLDRLIPEHTANLTDDYAQIEMIALQRKQDRELMEWLKEIRENVYIEYFIDLETFQTFSKL